MPESSLQSLGRYTIHAELGRGGFATVYRALDSTLEREVALKVLKPGWTDDAKAVERFMREAKQAARLKHPNIVTIFDVGQAEGRLFIAMELVPGRSLQQIIAEDEALPWPRVLAILEQTATALDYAHKQGLIHRDIKPANIILDETSPTVHVMLTDFGLVRGAEQASLSTGTTGGLIGTPEYIAPEIWDGEPATTASDIYALGCVAYYLLTGQVLFSATTPMAVLKRHVEGPVFPQHWPNGVPAGVDAVLRRALAKEPNQRPASATEFVMEVRAREKREAKQQVVEQSGQTVSAAEVARRAEEGQTRQAELAAQAAALEKAKHGAAEREQQRQAVEAQDQRSNIEARRLEKSLPTSESRSNRNKWAYIAGVIVVLFVVGLLIAPILFHAPVATPAPTQARVPPTQAPAAQASAATLVAAGSGWCANVKIVFFPGGPEGGVFAVNVYNGAVQAAKDLGANVSYVWSGWDPQKMIQQFTEAVATKPDGIAVMGHPGDEAFDSLIDDAESKGILVTSQNTELPKAQAKYGANGFGYVGAVNYDAGHALGAEAVKRFGLKSGDRAMVWGLLSQPSRGERTKGVIDAFKEAGLTVDYNEIDSATNADPVAGTATFSAYVSAHPDVKVIVTDHGGLTATAETYLKAAGKKPGDIRMAGFDLSEATVAAIQGGWMNLVIEQQEWLQGYLPILQICLTKVYRFSGLNFNTSAGLVDKSNVDYIAPLAAKNIR